MVLAETTKDTTVLKPKIGTLDLRQSPQYGQWMNLLGWEIIRMGKTSVFLKRLPFVGSIIKIQRSHQIPDFPIVKRIADRERAVLVKIEPSMCEEEPLLLTKLRKNGYHFSRWALIATKTQMLDLRLPQRMIFNQFKKDCRGEIRKAMTFDFAVEKNNFRDLYEVLQQSNKKKGLWTLPMKHFEMLIKSFEKRAFCIILRQGINKEAMAGCLILIAGNRAYYFLAGSTIEGKKRHAPYLVVWEAIKEAKKRGCLSWDFEGIYDERISSTKSWKGFTHFKKSFGGFEVIFPGSFTWYRNPILRLLSPFMG